MIQRLNDRPINLFGMGLKLLALRHNAIDIGDEALHKAIEAAIAEVDHLLLDHMEKCSSKDGAARAS